MNLLSDKPSLTFDDVTLLPQYSDLDSRSEVDISTNLPISGGHLELPIISAPMDTVSESEMIATMMMYGGLGVHHRYCHEDVLLNAASLGFPIAVAPSMGVDFLLKVVEISPFPHKPTVRLDIAHGFSKKAIDYAAQAVKLGCSVMSGNVVTHAAAMRYLEVGVNVIVVGVGGGSACTTRQVAGVGYPQLSAINNIHDEVSGTYIIADGGIKTSGDIIKALAAGADAVMIGGLLSGTDEAPGEVVADSQGHSVKEFRGMASKSARKANGGKGRLAEGVSSYVSYKGSVADILVELREGIKQGFFYLGARNVQELRENSIFVRVTQNGLVEGSPRI